MKALLALSVASFVLAIQGSALSGSESDQKQTFVQEYCGYSITMPDGWKQVLDEKDIDIKTWGYTAGLYRYNPQPGKQPGLAEWIYLKDPGVYLAIHMQKRDLEYGFSRYANSMLSAYLEEGLKVVNKGSTTIQERQCKWWQMTLPDSGDIYMLCIGNKEYFYLVTFTTLYISQDLKKQFDDIMQTMTFSS